jgi:hypothetical protein
VDSGQSILCYLVALDKSLKYVNEENRYHTEDKIAIYEMAIA